MCDSLSSNIALMPGFATFERGNSVTATQKHRNPIEASTAATKIDLSVSVFAARARIGGVLSTTDATVLIQGESGTERGRRPAGTRLIRPFKRTFIPINCGAIP